MDFLKQGGKEPELKEKVGMQLDKNLVATRFVTLWAQKFALWLTWLADQLVVKGMVDRIQETMDAILQSW
jgi:hypothetical protein